MIRVIFNIFDGITGEKKQFPVILERKQNKGNIHGWYYSVRSFGKSIVMSQDAVESFMGQSLTTRQTRKVETGWIF